MQNLKATRLQASSSPTYNQNSPSNLSYGKWRQGNFGCYQSLSASNAYSEYVLKRVLSFFNYICVWTCACLEKLGKNLRWPGVGVMGTWELSDMGSGNWTWSLWRRSTSSSPLNRLSSQIQNPLVITEPVRAQLLLPLFLTETRDTNSYMNLPNIQSHEETYPGLTPSTNTGGFADYMVLSYWTQASWGPLSRSFFKLLSSWNLFAGTWKRYRCHLIWHLL